MYSFSFVMCLKVEREHGSAGQSLRAVLSRAESACPGLLYHVLHSLAGRAGLHHQNATLYAAVLRHQANIAPTDDGHYLSYGICDEFNFINPKKNCE